MSSPGQPQYVTNMNYNEPPPPKQNVVNFAHLKTIHFILKVALILMLIAGAISVSVRYDYWSTSRYYNFVAVTGIVIAVIVTLLYVFRITDRFEKIPWNFIEMIYDVLWAILALIAAAILTDYARKYQEMDSYAAGAFFGYAAMLLYLIDAAFRFVAWRNGTSLRFDKRSSSTPATQSAAQAPTISNPTNLSSPNYQN